MSSLQTTPYVRDIVESYVHYRKVAGLKPLGRSHKVYQLLYHAVQRTQGMLTPELLAWWWKKRATEQPQSHLARVLEVVPMLRYAAGRWNIPQIPALPEKGCVVQRAPHIFTREELTAFFQACDTMHKPGRNRESLLTELEVPVMFRLMYANGLRPNECRLLPRECVDLKTGVIRIEQTKGYIQHRVVAKPDMLAMLGKYDAAADGILPDRKAFFPDAEGKPHRNDWLCRQFNSAWYRYNDAHATAYDLRHNYVIANIYSWREQGIGYGLTDRLLALSKSLGHARIASTLYYFSLVPAFEGGMADELESALERLADETSI
jgi:integrase